MEKSTTREVQNHITELAIFESELPRQGGIERSNGSVQSLSAVETARSTQVIPEISIKFGGRSIVGKGWLGVTGVVAVVISLSIVIALALASGGRLHW